MGNQETIKRYIGIHVPVTTCNLRCSYCYITQERKFDNALPVFKYGAEHIGRALSRERLGGPCLIGLCGGGETLLPPEINPIIRALLENGHYLHIVTNGTLSKRIDELLRLPEALRGRIFFKLSFHYLELKRLNMLDTWAGTVNRIRNARCSMSVEIMPTDELIPYIDEIKRFSLEKFGAYPHLTVGRDNTKKDLPVLTKLSLDDYYNTWSVFDSALFDFKFSTWSKKQTQFCYAGLWFCFLNLGTGMMAQCYQGIYETNAFEDVDSPIDFKPIGHYCPLSHCYNSHVCLTLGVIPDLDAPTYADVRDRKCADGTTWLNPVMRAFMSGKLRESNDLLSAGDQKRFDTLMSALRVKRRLRGLCARILRRLGIRRPR